MVASKGKVESKGTAEVFARDLLRNNFVRATAGDSGSEMLGSLAKAKQTHAIVFDESGVYLGITSKQAILKKRVDLSRAKVENFVEKKPFLQPDTSLQSIAEQMVGADSKILPVAEGGKISGAVFAIDVVRQIKNIKELRDLEARNIASLQPVVLPFESTYGQLLGLMNDKHVSKVILVGKNNELKGMVSFSDLTGAMLSGVPSKKSSGYGGIGAGKSHDVGKKERDITSLPVSDWIISDVRTVAPKEKLSKVIDLLSGANISDVVLVEKNRVAGIVTLSDLLDCFVRLKKERRNIQFVNMPELDEIDSQFLNNAISECFDKLKKVLGQINYFVVHFKFHESDAPRRKTSVHLRVSTPKRLFLASSTDWVLLDAAHSAIKTLEREVFESSKR